VFNARNKYGLYRPAALPWFEKNAYCAGNNILNLLPSKALVNKSGIKKTLQYTALVIG
jgi:hypothetical protein